MFLQVKHVIEGTLSHERHTESSFSLVIVVSVGVWHFTGALLGSVVQEAGSFSISASGMTQDNVLKEK